MLSIIVLAGIPWYLPSGTIELVILGLPYWVLISVFFSFVLCGYLSWLCLTQFTSDSYCSSDDGSYVAIGANSDVIFERLMSRVI